MKTLLKKLIQANSTTEFGELQAAEVLCKYFAGSPIDAKIDLWDKNRANLIARFGSQGPTLLFAAHLDVVPPGDAQWKYPPFDAIETDGCIHGRGSADMKAGITATAAAITEIANSGIKLKGRIIFAATAGEESDSCGIMRFVKEYGPTLPELTGVIIPEPTDFDIVTAHRGILWLKISTFGKTAHGSMPEMGINAIESMNDLLNRLRNYSIPQDLDPDMGTSSMSINQIQGGKATNVVPDSCSVNIDIRTPLGLCQEKVAQGFRDILAELTASSDKFKAQLDVIRDAPAMHTDEKCEFVKTICDSIGIEKTTAVGYATDGPFIAPLNAPIVIFGPGNSDICHKPDEYVEIADVEKAKEYYKELILKFLT